MKIEKTNKYKVLIDTPYYEKGDILKETGDESLGFDYMSEFCTPIFKLGDKEISYNDIIWREKNGKAKRVQFTNTHVHHQTEVFPDQKRCEKYINDSIFKEQKLALSQNRSNTFENLKSWNIKLTDLDNLTISDLSKISNGIEKCIKQLENYE